LGVTLGVGEGAPGVSFPATALGGQAPAQALVSVFAPGQQRRIAAALSALQASGDGQVLSHPRVVTADQVQAVIEQGTELPYQVSASHGGTSIAFRKANLRLEVTPQITEADTVILHVNLHKDSVGQLTAAGYAIDTKHLSTQVRIDDGGTVMIGGIYERSDQRGQAGVPGAVSWPVLGWLFGQRTQQNSQRELLVFITPKILAERDISP
jgi:type IV pilus assembly protein PilQ